jgi:hypothetical protein
VLKRFLSSFLLILLFVIGMILATSKSARAQNPNPDIWWCGDVEAIAYANNLQVSWEVGPNGYLIYYIYGYGSFPQVWWYGLCYP